MEALPHRAKEERPWGMFERFTLNEQTTVKLIEVREAQAFSLQTHQHRDEFWRIISGSGIVTVGETPVHASKGDEFFVPRGTQHRIEGGAGGITILEIAFGEFDEQDIARLHDMYGRA